MAVIQRREGDGNEDGDGMERLIFSPCLAQPKSERARAGKGGVIAKTPPSFRRYRQREKKQAQGYRR